jgi:hypothetical protein
MKRMTFGLIFFLISLANMGWAQNPPVLGQEWIQRYLNYLSGETAFDHVARISVYHRIPASPGYHAAALVVADLARSYGLQDVRIHLYPADGQKEYWTWRSFPEWDGKRGELSWISPGQGRIADFEETPVSLAVYSQSADVTAEVVDIGYGFRNSDYEGKDVKGKIVFTTGFPSMVYKKAIIERGAIGIITWYNEATQPDAAAWLSLPAWNVDNGKLNPGPHTFAFVLSFFQGRSIKRALDSGKAVRIHAKVEAATRSGQYEVVTATIPGRNPAAGEIWFTSHLDHQKPGANDNASGCGVILEIARSISRAIREGAVPQPELTLRFLWGPEMIGNVMFLHDHVDLGAKVLGDFNLDTVGENQPRLNSSLWILRPPESRASYFADVAENLAHFTLRNNLKLLGGTPDGPFITSPSGTRNILTGEVVPFVGASDHIIFNDGSIAIPSVGYIHYPDQTWHTNLDKIENVDSTTLKRVAFMVGASAIALGWKDAASFKSLLANSEFLGDLRLAKDRDVTQRLSASPSAEDKHLAALVLRGGFEREQRVLESLKGSVQYTSMDLQSLESAKMRLQTLYNLDVNRFSVSSNLDCTIPSHHALGSGRPLRNGWKAPLDAYRNVLEEKLGDSTVQNSAAAPYLSSIALYEALNLADGSRSIQEIYDQVSAESAVADFPMPEPGALASFFSLLQKAALITIQ